MPLSTVNSMMLNVPVHEMMNYGYLEKISEFQVGFEPTTSVTLVRCWLMVTVLAGHFLQKNPVKRPSSPGVLVAQWLEHPTGVTEILGSIPT